MQKKLDDIYYVKLPSGDMRAAILDKITKCCQSIGQDSEDCVLDGMNRENNSFYIMLKGGKNFDMNNID